MKQETVDCKAMVEGKEIIISIPLKDIQKQLDKEKEDKFCYTLSSEFVAIKVKRGNKLNKRIILNHIKNNGEYFAYSLPDKQVDELILALMKSQKDNWLCHPCNFCTLHNKGYEYMLPFIKRVTGNDSARSIASSALWQIAARESTYE